MTDSDVEDSFTFGSFSLEDTKEFKKSYSSGLHVRGCAAGYDVVTYGCEARVLLLRTGWFLQRHSPSPSRFLRHAASSATASAATAALAAATAVLAK